MWQRYNQTSHIFEKSLDNGTSWTPLALSGAILTEGNINLPGGTITIGGNLQCAAVIAYGNIHNNNNTFVYPGRLDGTAGLNTAWYLASHASYGLYTNTGLFAVGSLQTDAAVFSKGVMYPGRIDVAGGLSQASWYLGSHGSYGLYCSTGFYLVGGIWEHNRATQMGTWLSFTPSVWADAGMSVNLAANYGSYYTLIGKTMIVTCCWRLDTGGTAVPNIYMLVPGGFTISRRHSSACIGYSWQGQPSVNGTATCQAVEGGTALYLQKDPANQTSWPVPAALSFVFTMIFGFN